MSLLENKRDVESWLEEMFEGDEIPQFDRTDERLMADLHKVYENYRETKKDAKLVTDFKQVQIAEYQDEINRMNKIMKSAGMSPGTKMCLEDEPLENIIKTLAEVSDPLGIDNPTEDDLDLALADVRFRVSDANLFELKRHQKIEREKDEMLETIKRHAQSENALKRENKDAQNKEECLNRERKKTSFMIEKLKEYSRSLENFALILKRNGHRKEISYEYIIQLKNDLDELKENELKPLQTKLKSYNGLPPSIELAKAEVAEAEAKLEALTKELADKISALHL